MAVSRTYGEGGYGEGGYGVVLTPPVSAVPVSLPYVAVRTMRASSHAAPTGSAGPTGVHFSRARRRAG